LVVDDNRSNRRILEQILRDWHMRPTCSATAADAMQRLRCAGQAGEAFRLVLVDAHITPTDGFQLVQQMADEPAWNVDAVMMLNSGAPPDDIARCQQQGISSYLLKPIKQSELLKAILRVLGRADPDGPPDCTGESTRPPRTHPLKILLAEDSLVNQKLVTTFLEKAGHEVGVASNGRDAVAAYKSQNFDLVLMDVQMPEMDGFEAAELIRAHQRGSAKRVPILAMTANVLPEDRQRCLDAGMTDYLAKPIRAQQLHEAILRATDDLDSPLDISQNGDSPLRLA
jgi:CheY-like chemotaxis protein